MRSRRSGGPSFVGAGSSGFPLDSPVVSGRKRWFLQAVTGASPEDFNRFPEAQWPDFTGKTYILAQPRAIFQTIWPFQNPATWQ
jgi:hypothetical protein